ncbi:MAG: prepilin-type N-terminal cleavage/methylation domain-containing protein [Patescibacteria group bacterium]
MKGFTLVEILIGIAILAVITTISFNSLINYSRKETLDKSVLKIESLLEDARSFGYTVHFSINEITENNEIYTLPSSVNAITDINGSGNDIVFDKMTGFTEQYGTITISLSSNPDLKKEIVIYKTGLIERN